MLRDVGTLTAGRVYEYRHDASRGLDVVTDTDDGTTAAYPALAPATGRINVWGAPMQLTDVEGRACLVPEPDAECAAEVFVTFVNAVSCEERRTSCDSIARSVGSRQDIATSSVTPAAA